MYVSAGHERVVGIGRRVRRPGRERDIKYKWEHDGDGRRSTHTARLRNLDDSHPVSVRALHLNVQLFVAHDKDHVYCRFE